MTKPVAKKQNRRVAGAPPAVLRLPDVEDPDVEDPDVLEDPEREESERDRQRERERAYDAQHAALIKAGIRPGAQSLQFRAELYFANKALRARGAEPLTPPDADLVNEALVGRAVMVTRSATEEARKVPARKRAENARAKRWGAPREATDAEIADHYLLWKKNYSATTAMKMAVRKYGLKPNTIRKIARRRK